ncbi:hypothetical protein MTYP_01142 [Methylophilaceae bacterium]|nr:hypothetical protein MTYP_01142 [Methylophilaceae bacterium]
MQGRMLERVCMGLFFTGAVLGANAGEDRYAEYTEESRKISQEFMQQLAGTLKQQLESAGTESAISICKEVAPALARQYSVDGRIVRRVSLKPRNQSMGRPSLEEKAVLDDFDERQRAGSPAAAMEHAAAYQDAQGRWFHYMKAIPTQPLCLQCHGKQQDISASVRALLAKEYPADQAVGYGLGEIRGAISIRTPLK